MQAANDLEMVLCMHVGSSSTMPQISSNSPPLANLIWGANRTSGTMLSWLFSSYLGQLPNLRLSLSEGNIGWMPYFLERAEQVLDKQRHWAAGRAMDTFTASIGYSEMSTMRQADPMTLDIRERFVITSSVASSTMLLASVASTSLARTTSWPRPIIHTPTPRGHIASTW